MTRRFGATLLLITGLLGATYLGLQQIASQSPTAVIKDDLPNTPPVYALCGWTWAYHPLAGTSAKFEQAIKTEIPEASAYAQAFGEDCRYEDGPADFAMLEADFYVRIPSPQPTAEDTFGDQIATVMNIMLREFPEESLRGGYRGFVEFRFEQNETEFVVVRVPIQQYQAEAIGLTGRELFQHFLMPP